MRIEYKLTKEDYYEFNLHHMSHFKKVNRSINIQRFLMPIIFTVFAVLTYRMGNTSLNIILPIYLLVSTGWVMLYPKFLQRAVNKRLNAILELESNKSLLEDKVLEVADDGLYEILEGDNRVLSSKEVVDIVETDKNVYVYLPAESAYIIPKKFFKDEKEKAEFKSKVERLLVQSDLVN